MTKLWFKAKLYGWEWYPSSWEGLMVLLGFLVIDFGNIYRISLKNTTEEDKAIEIVIETIILVAFLIWICWKTGERPRWRWGK